MARGAAWGFITILPVLALLGLVAEVAGLAFPPYVLFEWLTRALPGAVVTFGIDLLVAMIRALDLGSTAEVAKLAEACLALASFTVFGPILGLALGLVARRSPGRLPWIGAAGGALVVAVLGYAAAR